MKVKPRGEMKMIKTRGFRVFDGNRVFLSFPSCSSQNQNVFSAIFQREIGIGQFYYSNVY